MPPTTTTQMPTACFAPDLTDETLAKYKHIAANCGNPEVKDIMEQCLTCVEAWWELPESTRKDSQRFTILHRGQPGHFEVTPLEEEHIKQLWDVTPWMRELMSMEAVVNALPSGTAERPAVRRSRVNNRRTGDVTEVEVNVMEGVVVDQAAFDLKNAAMHLIWYCKELTLDREPLTQARLPQ